MECSECGFNVTVATRSLGGDGYGGNESYCVLTTDGVQCLNDGLELLSVSRGEVTDPADVKALALLKRKALSVLYIEQATPVIKAIRGWCNEHALAIAGMSAPQFGIGLRIAVIWLRGIETVMLNPELVYAKGEHKLVEGCMSFPGRRKMVTRPKVVKVRYLDENWQPHSLKGHDMTAQAIMHEMDHLDGKVILDY